MQGKKFTMIHEGGKTQDITYIGINQKIAMCWVPGGCGTYDFKLTNGECKQAPNWYIDGEDLEYAREEARENKVKFTESKRVPLKLKGMNKAPRKKQEKKVDPRQGDLF